MISIAEALAILRETLPGRTAERLPLERAAGRCLAVPLSAVDPSPAFTNSAMDGFAVRWDDIAGATAEVPVRLTLAGESRAGHPFTRELRAGEAVRISTGGALCAGADSVVPIEEVHEAGDRIDILAAKKRGQHVRMAGEEYGAGDPLLEAGTILAPPALALLATHGYDPVPVFRAPRAVVLVTGSELVDHAAVPGPGQIRDSNGPMLRAALEVSGAQVVMVERVGDDMDATVAALAAACDGADLILCSGGVSVGPHDLVKAAAEACGFRTAFWRVRQKPGKPLFYARHGETRLLGLPGNPVSAFMCYRYYGHPLVRYLLGHPFAHDTRPAVAGTAIRNDLPRAHLMRVRLVSGDGFPRAVPLERQGSHMLTTVSGAEGFVVLGAGEIVPEGERVEVVGL